MRSNSLIGWCFLTDDPETGQAKSEIADEELKTLFGEFLDQIGLSDREFFGHIDEYAHELIPATLALQVGSSEPFHADFRVTLGSDGNFQPFRPAAQGRHLDRRAEAGLGVTDGLFDI
jgi:hypothetical protein